MWQISQLHEKMTSFFQPHGSPNEVKHIHPSSAIGKASEKRKPDYVDNSITIPVATSVRNLIALLVIYDIRI
jgi:hypothetical protein